MILLLAAALAFQPATDRVAGPYDLLVLDVDWDEQLIAWKRIAPHPTAVEGGFDCGYPGMEEGSDRGVTLGITDLNGDRDQEFVVYAAAENESQCTPPEEQKKQLAAAKKVMTELGLDYENPVDFMVEGNSTQTNTGHTVRAGSPPGHETFLAEAKRRETPDPWGGRSVMNEGLQIDDQWAHVFRQSHVSIYRNGSGSSLTGVHVEDHHLLAHYQVTLRSSGISPYDEFWEFWVMVDTSQPIDTEHVVERWGLEKQGYEAVSVLAVNKEHTRAAVKGVATIAECDYPGQSDTGVILGLWDLKARRLIRSFYVYDPNGGRPCTTQDDAERILAEAKDRFEAEGLDISAPLPTIEAVDGIFTVGGHEFVVDGPTLKRGDAVVFAPTRGEKEAVIFRRAHPVGDGVVFTYTRQDSPDYPYGRIEKDGTAHVSPVIPLR